MGTEPLRRLFLATRNPAKLERLRWLVQGLDVELLEAGSLDAETPEDEAAFGSHREVAEAKARAWSRLLDGALVLASDGGVAIPSLGAAWSSLLTRRAAGERSTDLDRAQHLLHLMQGVRGDARRASWREAAALARWDEVVGSWEVETSEPMRVAESCDLVSAPTGFWVPGVLEFPRIGRRYGDLDTDERDELLDHWQQLRPLVRPAISASLAGAIRPGKR